MRVDDPLPGQKVQIDFGCVGMLHDDRTGRQRKLWALIVTLSFSRHTFVWPTFEQTTRAVCEGLEAAWRFFGAMPRVLVPDNMKAIVDKADALAPRHTRFRIVDPQPRKRRPSSNTESGGRQSKFSVAECPEAWALRPGDSLSTPRIDAAVPNETIRAIGARTNGEVLDDRAAFLDRIGWKVEIGSSEVRIHGGK